MFLLAVTLCLMTASPTEAYPKCERNWLWPKLEQKNCFALDNGKITILFSDGKQQCALNSGVPVEEYNDAAYIRWLACRCAKKAREQNYQWFALGNNNDCYTSCKRFNEIKPQFQPKDNCYHRFGNRDPVKAGEKYEPDDILVGGVGAMSVYELGNPPPLSCGEISADIEEENEMVVGALACFLPADVAILVDQSGSITTPNFNKLVEWLKDFIKLSYKEDNRVGLFGYDDKFFTYLMLEDSQGMPLPDILSIVSSMRYTRGSTLTQYALWKMNRVAFGASHKHSDPQRVRLLVVITDGETWGGVNALKPFTKETRGLDVTVIAVGIGETDHNELMELTGGHGERIFKFSSFTEFLHKYKDELTKLATEICDVADENAFSDY